MYHTALLTTHCLADGQSDRGLCQRLHNAPLSARPVPGPASVGEALGRQCRLEQTSCDPAQGHARQQSSKDALRDPVVLACPARTSRHLTQSQTSVEKKLVIALDQIKLTLTLHHNEPSSDLCRNGSRHRGHSQQRTVPCRSAHYKQTEGPLQ